MPNEEEMGRRRRARLRQEMADAGVPMEFRGRVGDRLLEEVDYARFPPIHEHRFPLYGAILLEPDASLRQYGASVSDCSSGCSPATLRRMADGLQSFVVRRGRSVELAIFPGRLTGDDDLVPMVSQHSPVLAALQRLADGRVRLLGGRALSIWDGTRWWTKPYASTYLRRVRAAVPGAPAKPLDAILNVCVHSLSPSGVGATIVWGPQPGTLEGLDHVDRTRAVPVPRVSLVEQRNHRAVRSLLQQTDGATLVSHDAHMYETAIHLQWTRTAGQLIPREPDFGTRHTSAQRFSFCEPDTLVFVVSADGPVTVYRQGRTIASIRMSSPDFGTLTRSQPAVEPAEA